MLRRFVAFVLAWISVPAGLLYAGRPRVAAPALVFVPLVALVSFGGYAVGVLPASFFLASLLVPGVLWRLVPFGIALLPPRRGQPGQRVAVYAGVAVASFALDLGTILAARAWLAEPYQVPTVSMAPALLTGDFLLARKSGFGGPITPGAVIVFRHPTSGVDYVKRVVATGGHTVEVRDGAVWIDGVAVPRRPLGDAPEILDASCRPSGPRKAWLESLGGHAYGTRTAAEVAERFVDVGPVEVPAGHLYVLGDNRDNSVDSRVWGFVPEENVRGVVGDRWLSVDPCTGDWRSERLAPVP